MFAELLEYSQNMLSEAVWTPNIASSQFDEYPRTRFAKQMIVQLRISFVGLVSTKCPNYIREANVRPIKNGLKTGL